MTEMATSLLRMAGLIVALLSFLVSITALGRRFNWHPELRRKILHTGLGLSTLFLPMLFTEVWEIVTLGAAMISILMILRLPGLRKGAASGLYSVERASWGEILFVVSLVGLFIFSQGRTVLYVVPLLILTLSDAAAALVGVHFGKRSFDVEGGRKSLEGMLAFGVVTFVCVAACLLLLTSEPLLVILLAAFLIAVLGALTEAISWHGFDNLFVPAASFLLLAAYLSASVPDLLSAVCVLSLLLALGLIGARVAQMSVHALMVAAVMAYVFWQVGGLSWLAGPLIVFGLHLALGKIDKDEGVYRVDAALCVSLTAFVWQGIYEVANYRDGFFLYSLCLAIHAQIITLMRLHKIRERRAHWWEIALVAMMCGGTLMGVWLWIEGASPTHIIRGLIAVAAMAMAGLVSGVRKARFTRDRWVQQGLFALGGPALAFLLIEGLSL